MSLLNPADGLMQYGSASRGIAPSDGLVSYTVNVAAGQRLAFVAGISGTSLGVSLVNPSGQTVASGTATSAYPVVFNPYLVTTAGTWTINLSVPSGPSGALTLQAIINGGLEYTDSSGALPQSIDASYINTPSGGRYGWLGSALTTSGADTDVYTIDLTGKAGRPIDITVVAQGSVNLAGQRLDVLAPDGTTLATARAYSPAGQTPGLRVSNLIVPVDGIYTLRFTSTVSGQYGLVVTEAAALDRFGASQVLNLMVTSGWTTKSNVNDLLATLDFDQVFQSMSTDELLSELLRLGLINGYTDLATLKAALPGRGVDLTSLRADGVLAALAVCDYGNLLSSVAGPLGAAQAKNALRSSFSADRLGFVSVFSTRDLVQLFDDSIITSAGDARDQLLAYSTQAVPGGYANLVGEHQLWFRDDAGHTNTPTPQAALAATNLMPAGSHVMHLSDFTEIVGYGFGAHRGAGYLDPVDANGQPLDYYLPWMDAWLPVARSRVSDFFTQFKALGGRIDMLVMDIESIGMDYYSFRLDHRVDPNVTPSRGFFQAILDDPRWPALRDQLLRAGLTANDLTLGSFSNWSYNSPQVAIWNAVMQERTSDYLNRAIYEPLKQLFPNVVVTNYRYYQHSPTIAAADYRGLSASPYTIGPLVGNAQGKDLYGDSNGIYTLGAPGPATMRFQTPIRSLTFVQDVDGAGNPLASGTVTAIFGYAMSAVHVGDTVRIGNPSNLAMDSRFLGAFTVTGVAADGTSAQFRLQLDGADNPPANAVFSMTSGVTPPQADFWSAYKALVADVRTLRTEIATSNAPLTPWLPSRNWLLTDQGKDDIDYGERVFHAVLSGAENILWWQSDDGLDPGNAPILSDLLSEVDGLVGYAYRKPLVRGDLGFDDGYVLSGMEAAGKRVWRLTPDPWSTVAIGTSGSGVTFQIGNKVLTFANASIYTPSVAHSNLGYWIVQTAGSSQLVGSSDQVLAQIENAVRPTLNGPGNIVAGSAQTYTLSMNSALFSSSEQFTFTVDWNGDGTNLQTITGPSGTQVVHTFANAGSYAVSLKAAPVAFGGSIRYAASLTVTAASPTTYSLWSAATPTVVDSGDAQAIELGLKFTSSVSGSITGLRFYKSAANTGTHLAHLWTASGTLLATATFTGESGSGWQQVNFATPVAIAANTVYIASYYTSTGHYSVSRNFFSSAGVTNGPLTALSNSAAGGNGVYRYGASAFPSSSYQATNYWVDVVMSTVPPPDVTPPSITSTTPARGATNVSPTSAISVTFSEALAATSVSTATVQLKDANNGLVSATVSYDAASRTAMLTPTASLANGAGYTIVVKGGPGGVKDLAGNALASDYSSSFTTVGAGPFSLWNSSATPAIIDSGDGQAIEVGMKFTSAVNGTITGLRFYKSAANTGTHLAHLWTSTGTLLATATFSGETGSGWQQVNFATPVPISAGVTYVASYYTSAGHYSVSRNYFSSTSVTSGPLAALPGTAPGGNGVYRYGASGFPISSYQATNYWVDVVFQPPLGSSQVAAPAMLEQAMMVLPATSSDAPALIAPITAEPTAVLTRAAANDVVFSGDISDLSTPTQPGLATNRSTALDTLAARPGDEPDGATMMNSRRSPRRLARHWLVAAMARSRHEAEGPFG